jgi:hypothetical protein
MLRHHKVPCLVLSKILPFDTAPVMKQAVTKPYVCCDRASTVEQLQTFAHSSVSQAVSQSSSQKVDYLMSM